MIRFAIASLASLGLAWTSYSQTVDEPTRTFETKSDQLPALSLVEAFEQGLGVADAGGVRPMSALGLELIKEFEGLEPEAYNDAAGYCTIGYGHLIALDRCENIELGEFSGRLNEIAAQELLEKDTLTARRAVQQFVGVDLNDSQFSALSSFVFNVGSGNFADSTLLELLNIGEYDLAAEQLRRWVRAGGKVLEGLVTRRSCEESMFRGYLTLGNGDKFERSKCESLGAAADSGPLIDIGVGEK